ncbi:MAG: EamA/RhaT family transporter [Bacteroidetes bacterium]|nr:EamA/RhaT family transporter [Bacteroidota bacterium]
MAFLVLCIISSTAINLIFKSVTRFNANTFHVIVINYFIAALLGVAIAGSSFIHLISDPKPWMLLSVIIGALFIAMFHLMSLSVQKAGINPTTIAGRLSVIIPMLFSIIFYHEIIDHIKVWGIVMALISVILSVYKKREHVSDKQSLFLPLIIFLGAGLIDSLVKFSQDAYLNDELLPTFSALLFFVSLVIGVFVLLVQKKSFRSIVIKKNLLFGTALGFCNFGSIFFFVKALGNSGLNSSSVFGINHIGIVVLSVFFALILFKEKVNKINWIGIVLAICAIILLTIKTNHL